MIEDFLAAYGQLSENATGQIALRPLAPEHLRFRNPTLAAWLPGAGSTDEPASTELAHESAPSKDRSASAKSPPPPPLAEKLRLAARFLLRRASILAGVRQKRWLPTEPFPPFRLAKLPADELRALRHAAALQSVTVNDLLIRDAFLAIAAWNAQHARRPWRRWLRLAMPTNLRSRAHNDLPAANVMSYAFLDRRREDCQDPQALLAGIAEESRIIRAGNLSLEFLLGLDIASRWPRLFRAAIGFRRCMATVALTYLGDPTRRFVERFPRRDDGKIVSGNVALTLIAGCPPIRELTRAAVTTGTYGGELTVGLRADRRWFSESDAQRFLDSIVERLRASMVDHGGTA
ncbi:MAG TPA: hypothetical protein VHZ24_06455 [Pirellulales bacterium]|nr:hypothetical protein [Pirellulales bacterium]